MCIHNIIQHRVIRYIVIANAVPIPYTCIVCRVFWNLHFDSASNLGNLLFSVKKFSLFLTFNALLNNNKNITDCLRFGARVRHAYPAPESAHRPFEVRGTRGLVGVTIISLFLFFYRLGKIRFDGSEIYTFKWNPKILEVNNTIPRS